MFEHDHVFGFVPKFDLDGENNIPAYFSSFILLISAVLLGIIAEWHKRKHDLYYVHWLTLSVIFLFLSIDEAASLHEICIIPLRLAFNLSGIFYFPWVIGGFIFLLFLSLFYLKFFLNLPSNTRYQFGVSAFLYIGGALGVEILGGYYLEAYGIEAYGKNDLMYGIITTFEESFEMIGILFFIRALLKYMEENLLDVLISFRQRE
jgi:hypothetical protein